MLTSVRPPYLVRKFYKDFTWNIPGEGRKVYLTFDDGPLPEITEFILDTLKQHNVRATFFCVGNNVKQNPAIYERILKEGHRVGNHTFFHKNGWLNSADDYLRDIKEAQQFIDSDLFRPPYGKIKRKQAQSILPHYRIVMWDVLSYDFEPATSPQKCLENVTNNTRPGSIVVFHDNPKAFRNVKEVLPHYLSFLKQNDYFADVVP